MVFCKCCRWENSIYKLLVLRLRQFSGESGTKERGVAHSCPRAVVVLAVWCFLGLKL